MRDLIGRIWYDLDKNPLRYGAYDDLFSACRLAEEKDFKFAHDTNKRLRRKIGWAIARTDNVSDFFSLYKRTLLFDAVIEFDSYMLYIEINRPPEQRFYQPRRRILKQLVDAIQALTGDELDELYSAMPPRTGKTTLILFLITWLIGKNSEKSNLYSAYSDVITTAMYNGVLEVIGDPETYLWHDVFPNAKIIQTNAKDETINIDRKKRYPSLTCRSLYGTLNGACDCSGVEIWDDLIGGIEEALNPARMESAWSKVDNNLIPRAKEQAKIWGNGTRWSLKDPVGQRIELLKHDKNYRDRRWKIINLPALNVNDESNFDYDYGVGFSTKYYQMRRASFERSDDLASWNAQYMQEPVERDGKLFKVADMRFFDGTLPEGKADRRFMPVDPAFGGGDYVSSPVCYQYGEDIYVVDVVYDNGDKEVTQPLLVNAACDWDVETMRIEATKATETYKDGVEARLKERDRKIHLLTKAASTKTTKEIRIYEAAPDIKKHMIFLIPEKRTKAYEMFMQNVFLFSSSGGNKHDDAPDSLEMAIDMSFHPAGKAKAIRRPF